MSEGNSEKLPPVRAELVEAPGGAPFALRQAQGERNKSEAPEANPNVFGGRPRAGDGEGRGSVGVPSLTPTYASQVGNSERESLLEK
jgi:hypothetical protein